MSMMIKMIMKRVTPTTQGENMCGFLNGIVVIEYGTFAVNYTGISISSISQSSKDDERS